MIFTEASTEDDPPAEASVHSSAAPAPSPNPILPRTPHVLLVEDNAANAFLLQAFLEQLNIPEAHHVTTIAAATQLLPEIIRNSFDLIVLDIMLPDGESYDLAETIAQSSSTPLFAYTARTALHDMARMEECGFDHIIQKPTTFDVFVQGLATKFPEVI